MVVDGCEPPCGCWELNSGPLEEQTVLLTSEPSLQPKRDIFEVKKKCFLKPTLQNYPPTGKENWLR